MIKLLGLVLCGLGGGLAGYYGGMICVLAVVIGEIGMGMTNFYD